MYYNINHRPVKALLICAKCDFDLLNGMNDLLNGGMSPLYKAILYSIAAG